MNKTLLLALALLFTIPGVLAYTYTDLQASPGGVIVLDADTYVYHIDDAFIWADKDGTDKIIFAESVCNATIQGYTNTYNSLFSNLIPAEEGGKNLYGICRKNDYEFWLVKFDYNTGTFTKTPMLNNFSYSHHYSEQPHKINVFNLVAVTDDFVVTSFYHPFQAYKGNFLRIFLHNGTWLRDTYMGYLIGNIFSDPQLFATYNSRPFYPDVASNDFAVLSINNDAALYAPKRVVKNHIYLNATGANTIASTSAIISTIYKAGYHSARGGCYYSTNDDGYICHNGLDNYLPTLQNSYFLDASTSNLTEGAWTGYYTFPNGTVKSVRAYFRNGDMDVGAYIGNAGPAFFISHNEFINITGFVPVSTYSNNMAAVEGAFLILRANDNKLYAITDFQNESVAPPIGSYYDFNIVANYTDAQADFRSLSIINSTDSLIGGSVDSDETIIRARYNPAISFIDTADMNGDTVYKVRNSGNNVFTGTDDGIYLHNYKTMTQIDQQKWSGFLHSDNAYGVAPLGNDSAFVCDNHDEADYYQIGSEPNGSLGFGCYDIVFNGVDTIFVDTDEDGIMAYDVSDTGNPTYIYTRNKLNGLGEPYGDFLDYSTGMFAGLYDDNVFVVYDGIANYTSIAICQYNGAGTIQAVEIIDSQLAVAGTDTGWIITCNLDNATTSAYLPGGYDAQPIRAMEFDGTNLQVLTENYYVIYDMNVTLIYENTPPNVASVTYSATQVQINQPVDVAVVAGNVEIADVITYGLKCFVGDTWKYNNDGSFTCTYDTDGAYLATAAVTDNFHTGTWYDETQQQIIVTPTVFTGGILRMTLIDADNGSYIAGAEVLVDDVTKTSNAYGYVAFNTTTDGTYLVTIVADGYYTEQVNLEANGGNHPVVMTKTTPSIGGGALVIYIKDANGVPLENGIASYTDVLSYLYDYKYSNAQGRVVFTGIKGEVLVMASKDTYQSQSQRVIVVENQTTTVEFKLSKENAFQGTTTDRGCIDNGVWLCGDNEIVQHTCSVDADCELSNFCTPGLNTCSRFNYSKCDENDLPRNSQCVRRLSGRNVMDNILDWILANLLYIIAILIIIVIAGLMFTSWKRS